MRKELEEEMGEEWERQKVEGEEKRWKMKEVLGGEGSRVEWNEECLGERCKNGEERREKTFEKREEGRERSPTYVPLLN